jgi:hypothetical protein
MSLKSARIVTELLSGKDCGGGGGGGDGSGDGDDSCHW